VQQRSRADVVEGSTGLSRDSVLVAETRQLRLAMDASRASLGEPLLRAGDAAELLSVRTSWVYEAVRDGRLPCVRVGHHVRFLRGDLEAWVSEQRDPGRRR
jgi:excisionase family DNA binding protein